MPDLDTATSDVTTSAPNTEAPAAEQVAAASDSSSQGTTQLEVVHDGAPVPLEGETIETQDRGETDSQKTDDSANDSENKADETKTEDKPREEKKRGADTRIRNLVNNEKVYKDIIKNLNPDYDIEAALKNGVSEADARMDALEHNQARDQLTHEINQLNTDLQQQTDDLITDYPFMDTSNKERTPEDVKQADMIMDLWFEAAKPVFLTDSKGQLVEDSQGNPVFESVNTPLYEFVDKIMNVGKARVEAATNQAEIDGQRNAEQKLAAVEIPTGGKPATGRSNDASLSAAEYATTHKLERVG